MRAHTHTPTYPHLDLSDQNMKSWTYAFLFKFSSCPGLPCYHFKCLLQILKIEQTELNEHFHNNVSPLARAAAFWKGTADATRSGPSVWVGTARHFWGDVERTWLQPPVLAWRPAPSSFPVAPSPFLPSLSGGGLVDVQSFSFRFFSHRFDSNGSSKWSCHNSSLCLMLGFPLYPQGHNLIKVRNLSLTDFGNEA